MGSSQTTLAAGIASCAAPLNAFQINKLVANRMRGFMTFRGRYVQTRVVGTKTVLVVAKAGAVPGATTHVFEIVNIAAPTAPKYVLKHLPTNMCVQSDGMHLALVNCNNVGARSVIGVRNV